MYLPSAKAPCDCALGCAAAAAATATARGGGRRPRVSAVQTHWRQQHGTQVTALAAAARVLSGTTINPAITATAAVAPVKRRRHVYRAAVVARAGHGTTVAHQGFRRLRAVEVVALQRCVSVLLQMVGNHRLH